MPYVEEIMSIGRADNGYVLTVRVPYNEEESYPSDRLVSMSEREKVIVCKDMDELLDKVGKIIPALRDKMSAQEAFDTAFEEAEK